jgi:hypothetical protein
LHVSIPSVALGCDLTVLAATKACFKARFARG